MFRFAQHDKHGHGYLDALSNNFETL